MRYLTFFSLLYCSTGKVLSPIQPRPKSKAASKIIASNSSKTVQLEIETGNEEVVAQSCLKPSPPSC